MPRDLDMLFPDLLKRAGGDMDTMRRVEQFGPDILKQYGEQPPEMLPAGNPMLQMPTPVSVQDEYADLQLPPTVADPRSVPAYDPTKWQEEGPTPRTAKKYSGPAKGFSKIGATSSDSPAEGFTSTPGRKGGPVTKNEMAALNTPTVPQAPSNNLLDAVIAEQLSVQSGVPTGDSVLDEDTMMKLAAGSGAALGLGGAAVMGRQASNARKIEANQQANARLNTEYGPRPQADIQGERLAGEYGPTPKMLPSSQGSPDTMKQDVIDQSIRQTMPSDPAINSQMTEIKDPERTPYQSKTMQGMNVEREFAMKQAADEFGQALSQVKGYEHMGPTFANQLQQAIIAKDEATVRQMLSSLPDNMYQDFWNRVNRLHNNDPGIGLDKLLQHRAWLDNERFLRSKGESITNGLRAFRNSFR